MISTGGLPRIAHRRKKKRMAIRSPRYRFDNLSISFAPTDEGVYWLWDGEELIFIGRATGHATIKSCLQDHCAGDHGECTQKATHYGWELVRFPAWREAELLEDFVAENKRRPRCMRA